MITSLALLLSASVVPGWTPLFDGTSLKGWKQMGGAATYEVSSGEIVGKTVKGTPNSFLCTEREYANFELEYEVWVDPKLNSGVQIRSHSVGGYQNGRVHGYQIEIDPSERAWSGGFYEEGRRGWLFQPSSPRAKSAFKNGQWNRFKVWAHGDRFRTWVNGIPVTDTTDKMTQSGFIGLQVHSHDTSGAVVKWRNLRIRDLGHPKAEPPKEGKWLLRSENDIQTNWLSGRDPSKPAPWSWVDWAMQVKPASGDVVTKDKFQDFQMHVEFMVDDNGKQGQANGNSGVYLQNSYEVQILNSAPRGPANNECAGVYTIKAPDIAMAKPAGQWQTYDITFTAARWEGDKKVADARLTLVHNGTMVHDNIRLPNPTGAGEPESPNPRPVRLQDHGNLIRFRNIWVAER